MMDDTQNIKGTKKEKPGHYDSRQSCNREQARPNEKPVVKGAGLDDNEIEEDLSAPHPRSRHGGRPEKKVYEEWENDPYCE